MLSFLLSVIFGQLRHAVTAAGGALLSSGLEMVNGIPAVHNVETAVSGAILVAAGSVASYAHKAKLKTVSGPVYKFNN